MYQRVKNYTLTRPLLKKTVGGVFVFIGFIVLITPLTPGAAIFTLIGFELLGFRFLFLERFQQRIFKRRELPIEN